MALSEQLTNLTGRAKEAEDRAVAARGKAHSDLEREVAKARASADAQAERLRQEANARKGKLSVWWSEMQRSWNGHLEKIRHNVESKRSEHDTDKANRHAVRAEEDADYAIEFAIAAIDEAEYAVLDAILAREEADSMSHQVGAHA